MLVHHDGCAYNEAASEAAREARAKMEKIIEGGRVSAARVFDRVQNHVPVDRLAKGKGLRFGYASTKELAFEAQVPAFIGDPALTGQVNDEGIPLQVAALLGEQQQQAVDAASAKDDGPSRLVLEIAEGTKEAIHSHALTQIAGRAGIPGKYLAELSTSENPILRSLALEILESHYRGTDQALDRYLLRSVDGELRGFLSDKYRRLDNRPLLEAFALACQEMGAVPVDGTASDVRVAMKAFLPYVLEPVPNEVMLIGVEWANSDFGAAALTLSLVALRLWCTNKATMQNALRNVHLGRRLDENISYSEETYRLDTQATVSAMRDTVKDLLSPNRVNALQETIKAASAVKATWHSLPKKVLDAMTKSEAELAKKLYDEEQPDIMMLPAEKTVWRASNVLSWLAGQAKDADHKLDLERAAGEVIAMAAKKAA